MERKKLIKLAGLNLGIVAANIIILPAFADGAFAIAFGSAFIFLSGAALIYGNYRLLRGPDGVVPTPKMTPDEYIEVLNAHSGLRPFEKDVELLIDQVQRLQKKNKIIRGILLQKFSPSEITYNKVDAVISGMEETFYGNISSILDILNTFDEGDYISTTESIKSGKHPQKLIEEKLKVYDGYITLVKKYTEDNEQVLLKLEKLLLEIKKLFDGDEGDNQIL